MCSRALLLDAVCALAHYHSACGAILANFGVTEASKLKSEGPFQPKNMFMSSNHKVFVSVSKSFRNFELIRYKMDSGELTGRRNNLDVISRAFHGYERARAHAQSSDTDDAVISG